MAAVQRSHHNGRAAARLPPTLWRGKNPSFGKEKQFWVQTAGEWEGEGCGGGQDFPRS